MSCIIKTILQWAVAFLSDHNKAHCYFYLITVYTGLRRGAGTKSNVYFVLTGDYSDTGIRVLNDGIKEVLFINKGCILCFVIESIKLS